MCSSFRNVSFIIERKEVRVWEGGSYRMLNLLYDSSDFEMQIWEYTIEYIV